MKWDFLKLKSTKCNVCATSIQRWKKVDAADSLPVLVFHNCAIFCLFFMRCFKVFLCLFCNFFGFFANFCKILSIFSDILCANFSGLMFYNISTILVCSCQVNAYSQGSLLPCIKLLSDVKDVTSRVGLLLLLILLLHRYTPTNLG